MTALRLAWQGKGITAETEACGLRLTVSWMTRTHCWGAKVGDLASQGGFTKPEDAQRWAESWLLNFALNLVTTLQPPVTLKKGG